MCTFPLPRLTAGRFLNIPELLRQLRQGADVKTGDDVGLPTPAVSWGNAETVFVAPPLELEALVAQLGWSPSLLIRVLLLRIADPTQRWGSAEDALPHWDLWTVGFGV